MWKINHIVIINVDNELPNDYSIVPEKMEIEKPSIIIGKNHSHILLSILFQI